MVRRGTNRRGSAASKLLLGPPAKLLVLPGKDSRDYPQCLDEVLVLSAAGGTQRSTCGVLDRAIPTWCATTRRRRHKLLDMDFYRWESMPKEVLQEKIARKVISGERAMVAQVFLAKGAIVPEHHHESEQITYILEGALEFQIEGRVMVVRAGEVLRIPSEVPHRAVALEDTLDLDIFSPIRLDWLTQQDHYLRRGE